MQKMYHDHGYLPPPNKTLDYFSLDCCSCERSDVRVQDEDKWEEN